MLDELALFFAECAAQTTTRKADITGVKGALLAVLIACPRMSPKLLKAQCRRAGAHFITEQVQPKGARVFIGTSK